MAKRDNIEESTAPKRPDEKEGLARAAEYEPAGDPDYSRLEPNPDDPQAPADVPRPQQGGVRSEPDSTGQVRYPKD